MSRFYVTTPIYYVNDVPHIGHAYTTVAGDVLDPVAPAVRRRRLLSHRHRRARPQGAAGGRGAGARRPRSSSTRRRRPCSARRGTASTSPTTTSSARPSRATTRRCSSSCRRSTTRATSSSAPTKACTACRARRTTPKTSSSTATARSTAGPVEHVTEENYFFKLSRYEDRLLAHYAEHPEAVQPESRLNEVLGFIRGGLQDFSMSRTSITGACRCRGIRSTSPTCGPTRCSTTAPRSATAPTRSASRTWWPVDYHLVGKDILRFHAVYWPAMLMSAGIEPPKCVFAHGWLLVGGEKMSKTQLEPDRAGRSRRRLRRRRVPLPLHGRPALRSRRRLLLRGDGAALQRRPREQLRQPREPRAEHGGELLRRRRARRRAPTGRSSTRPRPRSTGMPDAMTRLDFAAGSARSGT